MIWGEFGMLFLVLFFRWNFDNINIFNFVKIKIGFIIKFGLNIVRYLYLKVSFVL